MLEKFEHRCAYCHTDQGPFELDHIRPRSRGGSNRVSNLALSCHACNGAKGNLTAAEWGHPEVEAQAKIPLKDAAAMNASRFALVEALHVLGLPIGTWSGGRTRWNRDRFGIEKDHCLDALCVGDLAGVVRPPSRILVIRAQGRGSYQRTNVDGAGFPRGYFTRAETYPRLLDGRPGAGHGPNATQNGRGALWAGGSASFWFVSGRQGRWHQCEVRGLAPKKRRI